MYVINLLGGPGVGKSSVGAELFALLKWDGINCELVREYAKDVVWERRFALLENQTYIFAKQAKRFADLEGQVDVVVTDSPLLFSLVYGSSTPAFKQVVRETMERYHNVNYLLSRIKAYQVEGRVQTEAEAREVDNKVRQTMSDLGLSFKTIAGSRQAALAIYNDLREGGIIHVPNVS